MLAVVAGAFDIQRQVVFTNLEAVFLGYGLLSGLYFDIVKFLYAAALHAHHVIMVFAWIEFKDGLIVIKVMS